MDRNYDVIIEAIIDIIWGHLKKKPGVANFADIVKIPTIFIKTTLKDSKNVSRIRKCFTMQFIFVFLDITKASDFWRKKADVSTERVGHMIYMFFKSTLDKI